MMNKAILVGRLTADPELKTAGTGTKYVNFSIAVNNGFGDNQRTDFIRCVTFGKTAENLAQYQKKGALVGIEGRIQVDSYERDGVRRDSVSVNASQVSFLGAGSGSSRPNNNKNNFQQQQNYGQNNGLNFNQQAMKTNETNVSNNNSSPSPSMGDDIEWDM